MDEVNYWSKEKDQTEQLDKIYLPYEALISSFDATTILCEIGFGALHFLFAKKVTRGFYIGINYQFDHLIEGLQKTKAAQLENAYFICGDPKEVPIRPESIDIVFCESLFIHMSAPENCLAECYRILKLMGRMIAIEPEFTAYNSSKPALLKCLRAATQFTYRAGKGTIDIARELHHRMLNFGFVKINCTSHEIHINGEEFDRLKEILYCWYEISQKASTQLIKENWLSQADFESASKELETLNKEDFVYQRFWLIEAQKI